MLVTTHQRSSKCDDLIGWSYQCHNKCLEFKFPIMLSSFSGKVSFTEPKIKYNIISGNINHCWNACSSSCYILAVHLMHFLAYVCVTKNKQKS